mgnify:CR=1 FL=1
MVELFTNNYECIIQLFLQLYTKINSLINTKGLKKEI